MNNEVIKWLVGTPASDMNFKTNLKRATAAEIRETLKIIEGRREVKTKEKALRAELRRKEKMKGDRHTMKSLILTTQDARELDKLGGLTITKPIKPAPRYIAGASFSRDADCADIWHLVGQDGNRLERETASRTCSPLPSRSRTSYLSASPGIASRTRRAESPSA